MTARQTQGRSRALQSLIALLFRGGIRRLFIAATIVFALSTCVGRAAESPVGKIVAEVLPVNNKAHDADMIRTQMHTRAGKPYDETVVQEDVRRLLATRWFAPGGVRIDTSVGADGRVTVFVHVVELNNVVGEVIYMGNQHLSEKELEDLTLIRRGGPLNPAMNQLAARSIENKLKEDGRLHASVTLIEGDKLSDSRVVFRIVEGPIVRLAGVEFRGNVAASSGRLTTQLISSPPIIQGKTTLFSQKFHPSMIEEDKKRLVTYYHRLGYLDVRIQEKIEPDVKDLSKVTIVYLLEEGVQYKVHSIVIDGNKMVNEDRIRKVISLKEGERYDLDLVLADEKRIREVHGNGGVNAAVDHAWYVVRSQQGEVDVHYKVMEPGRTEPDRVGRIRIEGNTITDQRVILNQLGLYPGQILQYPQLEVARANLMRLGIFDSENPPTVEVIPQEQDGIYKDILVRVKETRTGMFAITANVNSDAGLSGSIVVNQRNFDILRVPTSLDDFMSGKAFRGGGQEMRIEAMPGTTLQRYSVTWREPYLMDTRFGITTSGYFYERAYAEYNEQRVGGRVTLDYRFQESPIWKATMTTRLEDIKLDGFTPWAPYSITNDAGHASLVGLRAGLNRDTRDSYLLPSKGSVLDFGVEQVIGSYFQYPVATAEWSQYYTMWKRDDGSGKQVLSLRSQLTAMGGNAPTFERIFAGGFRSLRGFSYRGVGPSENDTFTGGTFAFLNTIEYQIPVLASDKLWLVGFCDHGTVEDKFQITDYRVSVGVGLRIVVPAMGPLPIALDFGVPINKAPQDNKQIFSFYVGWFGGQ